MKVVVGVAVLDRRHGEARALVAQRNRPPSLAGCWEFPGGKVEPGETDEDALRRECREELAVEILLQERLGPDLPLPSGAVLRVWTARLAAGQPVAVEHAQLRWVSAAELDALPWIPADRPLVAELRRRLIDWRIEVEAERGRDCRAGRRALDGPHAAGGRRIPPGSGVPTT